MILNSKYGEVKVYAKTIEQEAIGQIIQMANSPVGENANVRIMPDAHTGAGCTIGTTMKITDKICPNLIGVDIGCGVDLVQTDIDFSKKFEELDSVIRTYIPSGQNVHDRLKIYNFTKLKCWDFLSKETHLLSQYSLGTLGGGNHFIESYENGWLSVHSGSRNIGYKVADYYQKQAIKYIKETKHNELIKELQTIEPKQREQWLKNHKISVDKNLCYLEGELMQNYLHDMKIIQEFAVFNRRLMLSTIIDHMNGIILDRITSIHNYIDLDNMILRKGAISAQKEEKLVIPLNMRDGILICEGKGNPDWNYSAPHGAGRLYSRSVAKEKFSVETYRKSMDGIFTTCVSYDTLDEAPFVYKDYKEIMECIEPTVTILDRLKPIYNFKAN